MAHDLGQRDFFRGPRQKIPPLSPPHALQEAPAAKDREQLGGVVHRDALPAGDLRDGQGAFILAPGHLDQTAQAVFF
ncbi:MAG: hypothetical protein A2992_10380 [Elusimicrobia bacterium RIFCSPLOWO2_01_FULL_59_12]|nr:MAG: hypothetical protein A2992_10380 [Elusimicrobia bacterium RIFCSPLOWO2_01_FULL_59_12]